MPRELSSAPTEPGGWEVIAQHYELCLKQYGATPRGADWPNGADLAVRFGVMLELLAEGGERPTLLDLGCGPGLLLDYLAATGGVDRSMWRVHAGRRTNSRVGTF